jgi:hypothetical protein
MFLILPLLLAIVCVPFLGGDLRRLAGIRFRGVWFLAASLGTQVWLIARPGPKTALLTAVELAAYPLGVAFLLMNRRIPGVRLIAAGALLNFVAIAANGGIMPASAGAVAFAGLPADYGNIYANSAPLVHPHLLLLGDIFAIPSFVPFAHAFSLGDILIGIGGVLTILRTTLPERGAAPSAAALPEEPDQPVGAQASDAAEDEASSPAGRP